MKLLYIAHRAPAEICLNLDPFTPEWNAAAEAPLRHFHARSSDHRPRATARLLHDDKALYLQFRVEDRYVRSVHTSFMNPVYRDSCVEFFVQPVPDAGYFNFEINAGGTLLATYVTDHRRRPGGGLTEARPLTPEEATSVRIISTLPSVVDPEIPEPITWGIAARIPFSIFRARIAWVQPTPGIEWRGNFYKCADRTSHPHWASWNPIGEALNFHCPEHFGRLRFE